MRVLGGYNLQLSSLPHSEAPLIIGSILPSRLRAWTGPIGIFSSYKLRKRFDRILEDLVQDPNQVPSALKPAEIRLWSYGGRLQGDAGQRVSLIRRGTSPKTKDLAVKETRKSTRGRLRRGQVPR